MNRIFKAAAEGLEKASHAFGMIAEKSRLMLAQAFNKTDIGLDRKDVFSLLREQDQKYSKNPGIHAATRLWELNDFLSDYCQQAGYGQRFCTPMEKLIERIADSNRLHVSEDILLKVPRPLMNDIIGNIDVLFDLEISDLKSIMTPALSGKSYNPRLSEEVICLHTGLTEMARKFDIGPYADPDYKDRLEQYLDDITLSPGQQQALDNMMNHFKKRGLE